MTSYDLDNVGLLDAFQQLQQQESAPGQWSLAGTKLPFGDELQTRFPLAGRFLDDQGRPAISSLPPERVASAF